MEKENLIPKSTEFSESAIIVQLRQINLSIEKLLENSSNYKLVPISSNRGLESAI